jgi:hypothetical protein
VRGVSGHVDWRRPKEDDGDGKRAGQPIFKLRLNIWISPFTTVHRPLRCPRAQLERIVSAESDFGGAPVPPPMSSLNLLRTYRHPRSANRQPNGACVVVRFLHPVPPLSHLLMNR